MNKKLFEKINNIYTGAIGHEYIEGEECLGANELAAVITALSSVFDSGRKFPGYFGYWNIVEFDSPIKATKHIESFLSIHKG